MRTNATGNPCQFDYGAHMKNDINHTGGVIARIVFGVALAFTAVMAMLPQVPEILIAPDKVQHALAFFVITALHHIAYRELGFWKRILIIAFIGGAIEIAQMIPVFHRDPDLADWAVDVVAALAASLASMYFVSGCKNRRCFNDS